MQKTSSYCDILTAHHIRAKAYANVRTPLRNPDDASPENDLHFRPLPFFGGNLYFSSVNRKYFR